MFVGRKSFAGNPAKLEGPIRDLLPDGEELLGIAISTTPSMKYNTVVLTNGRIALLSVTSSKPKIFRSIPLSHVSTLLGTETSSGTNIHVATAAGVEKICLVHVDDGSGFTNAYQQFIASGLGPLGAAELNGQPSGARRAEESKQQEMAALTATLAAPINNEADQDVYLDAVPKTAKWESMPKHLRKAVKANIALKEKPLFIITAVQLAWSGALVALPERMILIKSGAIGALMAGSLGGARVATFYYRDVTGIEYNSGFVTGVVEILTASYSGSANKDYWRGTFNSRNADANDPWTLSNTLPLDKQSYTAAKTFFDQLRGLIAEAKTQTGHVTSTAPPTPPVAPAGGQVFEQLKQLAELRDLGVVTAEEFETKKAELLARL